jgi:hypothetical protein
MGMKLSALESARRDEQSGIREMARRECCDRIRRRAWHARSTPGPHLQLGRLNRVAGATRLGLHFGVLHLQHAQIFNPSTLDPSTLNSQSGSDLPGSCPQPSPCLVGGTGSLGAHRPEPRSMPYAIVVGSRRSRPQPRGCLQGLQPSRHPHVHLNPPVLHCMATTFSFSRSLYTLGKAYACKARSECDSVWASAPGIGQPGSASKPLWHREETLKTIHGYAT